MIEGVTKSGFPYQIDDHIGDDYELLELMGRVRKNDTFAIFELIEKILGTEQHEKLKDHVRVDGRVPISAMNDEIVEIFAATNEIKKSPSSPS